MAKALNDYHKSNIVIPENQNTKMFRDLSRTDPNATKPFKKEGGFSGTSIDPAWRFMRLTEYFGPCGLGWGADQEAFQIVEGVAFVCMKLWYRMPNDDGTMGSGEKCYTAPQWGGSKLVKTDRSGKVTISDEALKMAATDALGKCAAMFLGLSADVYLGSFEDDKYRDESEAIYSAKNNPDLQPAAIEKFEEDIKEKLADVADLDQLDDLWKSGVNARIREIGTINKAAQSRLITAFSEKKNEILRRQEEAENGYGAHPGASDEPDDADRQDEPEAGDQPPADEAKAPPAPPPAKPPAVTPALEKMTTYMEKVQKAFKESTDDDHLRQIWSKEVSERYEACLKARLEATQDASVVINMFQGGANQVITRLKRIDTEANVRLMGLIQARRDKLIDDEPDQKSA